MSGCEGDSVCLLGSPPTKNNSAPLFDSSELKFVLSDTAALVVKSLKATVKLKVLTLTVMHREHSCRRMEYFGAQLLNLLRDREKRKRERERKRRKERKTGEKRDEAEGERLVLESNHRKKDSNFMLVLINVNAKKKMESIEFC